MKLAERIDAYRIFPRVVLLLYVILVGSVVDWYLNFNVKYTKDCDHQTLELLLEKDVKLERAEQTACTVTGVVGRPMGYTALVSTIVGAGAGIFGFYVNSGRRWREEDVTLQPVLQR